MRFPARPSGLLFILLVLLLPPGLYAQREKIPQEDLEIVEAQWPKAIKDSTGIRYIVEREGAGPCPAPGEMVSVLYVGKFLNGETFDKTSDPGRPLTFRVGRDQVVQGWDYIVQQMKRGERRLVIIPPELAYGTRGQPPRIPRNATLVFVMELVEIKPE